MGSDHIGQLVTRAALVTPDQVALRTLSGIDRTYSELDARTTRLANGLLAKGFTRGDRIAAWLDTCPQYWELYLAIAKAGLVLVPINAMFTEHEAAYQLEDSGAVALFHLERLGDVAARLGTAHGLRMLVPIGNWNQAEGPFEDLIMLGGPELPEPPDEDDLYVISYTSGTTGRPKGAMVTHRTLMGTSRIVGLNYRIWPGSTLANYANMSFVATVLSLMFGHLYVGGTIILLEPLSGPAELIDILERERATFTYVPSPWVEGFTEAAAANPAAWQHVKVVLHSASKCSPDSLRRLADVVGDRYMEGWGMTEASGSPLTVTRPGAVAGGNSAHDFFASVGKPCTEVAVRVVDEDGRDVPHDGHAVGELVVQSPSMVVGYWNRTTETAAAFRDGWFHTGDLGSMDASGYVYVNERRTDLIVSGGMNVYPSEIENVILRLDGVREVAVVGAPHERWGMTPVAFVVAEDSAEIDAEAVVRHCDVYLARYKRPSAIEMIRELPRNASQKVLRRVLRESAAASMTPTVAPGR